MRYFEVKYLEEAEEFLESIHPKAAEKLTNNIRLAKETNNPRLFKKLREDIWEFRARYGSLQARLLAFWDKTIREETLVVVTHGFIKKTDKTPGNEIERAKNIRKKYFQDKGH